LSRNLKHAPCAYAWLRQNKIQHASTGPQRLPDWNKNAAGIKAFYFKDPGGHPLEILEFPPDKGTEKWHRPSDKLFLGIDHTAIVVGDTEESLRFCRDLLGLRIVGESENYGAEQEQSMTKEEIRPSESATRAKYWKRWGPYLSEHGEPFAKITAHMGMLGSLSRIITLDRAFTDGMKTGRV
jgi:hypothetical protein